VASSSEQSAHGSPFEPVFPTLADVQKASDRSATQYGLAVEPGAQEEEPLLAGG
jgi:hypothetical protein